MATRLVVKNLPNSVTEGKLKELFGQKGKITDVQLKRLEDGKFRHFAFIGYKTAEEAESAREYFDKAFFGASKMQVDICYSLNDPNKPRPWSRHTKKEEKIKPVKKKEVDGDVPKKKRKEEIILERAKDDPVFLEFLELHSKSQAKWGNDTVLDSLEKLVKVKKDAKTGEVYEDIPEIKEEKGQTVEVKKIEKKSSKPAPEDTFFTVKVRDLPKKARKKDIKALFAPLRPKSIRIPPNFRGFAYVGFLTESDQKKALSKHRSIVLGNQVSVRTYISKASIDKMTKDKGSRWKSQTEQLFKEAESVSESGRIFVRNLSYTATEEELKEHFEQFGTVTEVHLPVDRITRQPKGFAFVSFLLPEHADVAFRTLSGTTFQGRMLHLLPSKSKDEVAESTTAGSSYKKTKEAKTKKAAVSSHNWNSLFLGQNAVSSVIAEKYGISRAKLLLSDKNDDSRSSIGVRMALAETEIVAETKKFLESQGVCLESFENEDVKSERSSTAMLVKNLVAGSTEDDLRKVFEPHGVLGRVVMPPSGITAIVEYMVAAEARGAFKKLAYSNFKGMPLFLEWAPLNVFRIASDGSKIKVITRVEETLLDKPKDKKVQQIELRDMDEEDFDENSVPESDTTLFVKNLNFSTTEDELKAHFANLGHVYAVTIAKKKDPKHEGEFLSQGFGFVQYYKTKTAARALDSLNQSMLKNHLLELKMSSRTLVSDKQSGEALEKNKKGSKILVRNVPFQATLEEITDLFKVFGKLKGVRMPMKTVGESQHRGFAFIDFFVEANAKAAFDTLSKSTHIYGRRLVLEWAKKDATVEELREKVAQQYRRQESGLASHSSTKKNLKRYFDGEGGKKEAVEDVEDT